MASREEKVEQEKEVRGDEEEETQGERASEGDEGEG